MTEAESLRAALRANLFDGDEGGTITMPIAQLLTDIVEIVQEFAATPPAEGLAECEVTLGELRQRVLDLQARWMLSEGDEAVARCDAYDDAIDLIEDLLPTPVLAALPEAKP